MATSKSVFGPWERSDKPILFPRPGKWDDNITTNPAPCVADDGSILLVYRSNVQELGTRLGVAKAEKLGKPFTRIRDNYMDFHVEDPYICRVDDNFEMIAKDQSGKLTEEYQAGVHATSTDGIDWTISNPAKACSREIVWVYGTTVNQERFERPQLLIENGKPICLY